MERLLERLIALQPAARLGILVGALAFVGAAYYQLFYTSLVEEREQLVQDGERLGKEKQGYERRKKEYLAYRTEVTALLEEQKDLLRVLPKKDDIEQFIESINAQVEVAGLSRVASVREPAVAEEMYMRIPIKMSLVGSYHQIHRFFKNVGELKRIVTISDLQLKRVEAIASLATPEPVVLLRADFVAQTFQFVDAPAAGAAATGAASQAGGAR